MVGFAKIPQSGVGVAVQRILIHQAGEAIGGGRIAAALVIERTHLVLGISQSLLDIAQELLRLGNKLAVRECDDQFAALGLVAQRLAGIAIGLVHLLVMD